MEFVKRLSPSEAKYKYVGLPKKTRIEFPHKDVVFDLKFRNKIYKVKVNNKDCIMLSQMYSEYEFQPEDEIKIIQKKDDLFELTVNPASSM